MSEYIDAPIVIRFDGLDADQHEIDLSLLAESLKGLSRIIGVAGNFVATGHYVQHRDAMEVRVVARPPEGHCFELMAWLKWASENPLISGIIGGLTVTPVTYIIAKAAGQREEMKHLRGALDTAIQVLGHRDEAVVTRLTQTIEKMADALRPSVRQAVAPIGRSASTLSIGDASGMHRVGLAEKETIMATEQAEVQPETTYEVIITELDMESGSCKLAILPESDDRHKGAITDPAFAVPNNRYALAMAAKSPISVRAKAVTKDGEIEKLFISDVAPAS
jgi:hypothetical protein